jgi:ribosomal protein S27AE
VSSDKKYHVLFRKAVPFKLALRRRYRDPTTEKTMEKYGVDEQGAENEKKASEGCPKCGSKVERHGNVLACPKCGTEPFEATKTT